MQLRKSLSELDAAADELLAKSAEASDELKPDEISESAKPSTTEEEPETEATENQEKEVEPKAGEESGEHEKEKKEPPVEKAMNPSENDLKKEAELPVEEETDSEEEEEESEVEPAEELEKAITQEFTHDENIRKSMDSSEFCNSVVQIIAKSLGDVQHDIRSQGFSINEANEVIAKSFLAVINSQNDLKSENAALKSRLDTLEKSLADGFDKILESLSEFGSQPAHMRKSIASVGIHERNFDASLNGGNATGGFENLTKSQVLDILSDELQHGNPNVTPQDIIGFESGAPLRINLQKLVSSKAR